jgi:hypothetical protein
MRARQTHQKILRRSSPQRRYPLRIRTNFVATRRDSVWVQHLCWGICHLECACRRHDHSDKVGGFFSHASVFDFRSGRLPPWVVFNSEAVTQILLLIRTNERCTPLPEAESRVRMARVTQIMARKFAGQSATQTSHRQSKN